MTEKGIVLITGINGYIAARTAEACLRAGYNVRGTARSTESARSLVDALSSYSQRFEVVEVPDVTVPGAFDNAVKGVSAIAQLASPMTLTSTRPAPIINTATSTVRGVLESAMQEPSVKSVVIMSSIAAIIHTPKEPKYVFTEKDWNDESEAIVAKCGDDTPGNATYAASKAASEKTFWAFRDEKKPPFTMTAINPVFVTGPPLVRPTSPDQVAGKTYTYIWNILLGEEIPPEVMSGFSWYVDVRDVADLVVFGIDNPDVCNGQRYIASADYGPPQAAADILRKAFPHLGIQEGQPGEGYLEGFKSPHDQIVDGGKAAKARGKEYISYQQSVLDTADALKGVVDGL
ncbi:hypothetical protein MGN70_000232 [Eutypa lata]|uniref:Putative nad dependent epimerase protein n=1 Tax=Eutypa lata (strain UCR-EL1) TaxID=1287681 RepID=M7TQR3_EUTLA|nr:putative nad dependent epimerase protein [Eutypa lata UCREL1]KAI1257193.1 hypothetical protein MGN70_000232 [Eutypa lata]